MPHVVIPSRCRHRIALELLLLVAASINVAGVGCVSDDLDDPPAPLAVELTADRTDGLAALEVNFTALVTGGEAPFVYDWDYGDENTASGGAETTHLFRRAGEYEVALTVTDDLGNREQA